MDEIVAAVAREDCKNILFGFTPKDTSNCTVKSFEEDDRTLFVLGSKENIFAKHKMMLPLLSQA
jgi:hypothetical protein